MKKFYDPEESDHEAVHEFDATDPVVHADRVNRSSGSVGMAWKSANDSATMSVIAKDLHAEDVFLAKRRMAEPKKAKHEPLDDYTYLPCGFCHSESSLTIEGIDLVCKVCNTHFGRDYVADMIQRGY